MEYPNIELGSRGYEPRHVAKVTSAIEEHFPGCFASVYPDTGTITDSFGAAITDWEREKDTYRALLDLDVLEEYSYDPGAFKSALRKDCPIIRRCLNSPMDEMKDYKQEFGKTSGQTLLSVTTNLAKFAQGYMVSFNGEDHEQCTAPEELGLSRLLTDEYTAFGVIGGGIKSHFLHKLHPMAFSNRSQNAIWALYYLTGKHDFGFHDGSEFLMVRVEQQKNTIQQNYHYPYDLFAYYALKLYLLLREACAGCDVLLDPNYRYVYVDAFADQIANVNQSEIQILKGKEQYGYFG